MSILVVDDDAGVRAMLEAVLENDGLTDVRTAESASEAFDQLGVDNDGKTGLGVDLVLMDISMPKTNGVEACRRIKSVPNLKDIPIIMVTGLNDANGLEQAFAAGAVDYITKPPNRVEMLARVRSALDLKREMDRRKATYIQDLEQKNQELKRAFCELEKKNRQLEEASVAKTQILSTATHELRTPLTSIVGYVDRMLLHQYKVGALNEKQQVYLKKVQTNSYRLKALVDDLLDISRIEAGGLDLTLVDLDVQQAFQSTIEDMQNQLSEKQIDLNLEFPSDPIQVRADRLRFTQVITNLLSNACKYSPVGASVTISAHNAKDLVKLDIADTGIGISEEDIPRLFTKFFRTDNSSTRKVSGTGLGLYISKSLVEAHGGSITATSKLGEGTTFKVEWPKAGTDPETNDTAASVGSH